MDKCCHNLRMFFLLTDTYLVRVTLTDFRHSLLFLTPLFNANIVNRPLLIIKWIRGLVSNQKKLLCCICGELK